MDLWSNNPHSEHALHTLTALPSYTWNVRLRRKTTSASSSSSSSSSSADEATRCAEKQTTFSVGGYGWLTTIGLVQWWAYVPSHMAMKRQETTEQLKRRHEDSVTSFLYKLDVCCNDDAITGVCTLVCVCVCVYCELLPTPTLFSVEPQERNCPNTTNSWEQKLRVVVVAVAVENLKSWSSVW